MNRIERYLGSVLLLHFLIVMLVLMVIFAFFEFMNQLGEVEGGYTVQLASLFTLLKLPYYSYEIFPIVLLIATLMGMGSLANHSELTILRVTGWSIKRILLAVLKTALLLWLLMALIGEGLAPKLEAYAKKIKLEAQEHNLSIGYDQGFWLKDENQFLFVDKVISANELQEIKVFNVEDGQLTQYQVAKSGFYEDKAWKYSEVEAIELKKNEVDYGSVDVTRYIVDRPIIQELKTDFALQPEDLSKMIIQSRYLSLYDLQQQIDFLQQNNLDASQYELAFWRKLSMPIVVIAMIAVVFPLVFGSMRQVSMGQRVFLGVLIGMGFHLINQLIGNVAVVYQLPIVVMTLLPALLVIVGSWWWLEKAE